MLRELQAALKRSGGDYLVGGKLSYADMAMAVAVQVRTGRAWANRANAPTTVPEHPLAQAVCVMLCQLLLAYSSQP